MFVSRQVAKKINVNGRNMVAMSIICTGGEHEVFMINMVPLFRRMTSF